MAVWPQPDERPDGFEMLQNGWRAAFEAAETALRAAARYLPAEELSERSHRLAAEREPTAALLKTIARHRRAGGAALLLPAKWDARRLLGLPDSVAACVFNLDGVLIPSAAVHAAAWSDTFDDLLSRRVERTHGRFAPFNPHLDYRRHMHGRPRLEGVREFLASRGIRLPEGGPDDPPWVETVHGLANRKNAALLRRLDQHGVTAFEGSRSYLEIAHDARVQCAVVSASANAETMLELAGLTDLIEARVDGNTILAQGLRGRPAPDRLLAACRQLGVTPQHAAAFETSAAGVAAGRAAGFQFVIGVDGGGDPAALRAAGADTVVTGLGEILRGKLAA